MKIPGAKEKGFSGLLFFVELVVMQVQSKTENYPIVCTLYIVYNKAKTPIISKS